MDRLLNDDRVRKLLREADDAERLLARLPDGPEAAEVREALSGIWRDLGRHVHQAWRGIVRGAAASPDDFELSVSRDDTTAGEPFDGPIRVDDATDVPEVPPEAPSEDLERWYTDEVEIEGSQPLFTAGELEQTADTELVDGVRRTPSGPEIANLGGRVVADDVENPPQDEIVALDRVASPLAGPPAGWIPSLKELVEMIGPPPSDGADLADEAARVQWATTNVEIRWAEFPPAVQTALLGLLAARARALQERLAVDLGPRLALDRLRRHRATTGLPPVVGLYANAAAETGSWREDAVRWWSALTTGLDAAPPAG